MIKEWKIKQEIYHRLHKSYTDDLSNFDVEISDDIVKNAVRYFTEEDVGWIYPAKSYVVGICYSRWLSDQYGGYPLEYLDDQDLLYGNDPYFVRYSKDEDTYIKILHRINGWEFDETKGIIPDIRKYFDEEFSYS
jgi:hypothetical protein